MKRALEPSPLDDVSAWYGNSWNHEEPTLPPRPSPPDDRHKRSALASKDANVLARVGLVMGRFRPPHVGHVHLVAHAFAHCGWLHIVTPSLAGAGAGRAMHDSAVRSAFGSYGDVHAWAPPHDAHDPAAWAHGVETLEPRPTHLFSSDTGAEALARAAQLEHVLVDPGRVTFPVSSSMIRADLARHFALIAPWARQWFAFTVGIVGAEGSGKSTLARELGTLFDAPVVDDLLLAAARARGGVPTKSDFFNVYHNGTPGQMLRAANESKGGIVVSEASRLVTWLWAKRLGISLDVWTGNHYDQEQRGVWLLCHNDFPYSGERDEPEARRAFFGELRGALQARPKAIVIDITGEGQPRVDVAAAAIQTGFAAHAARVREWLS